MSSRALVFVGIGPDHTSDNFNVLPSSRYEKWCYPIISGALAFVGTGLNQKSDNFKVPFCSCNVKGRCSIICGALVFVGTGLKKKNGQLQGALLQLLCEGALLHHLWRLGLCWHRTQREIGQLQGAPDELP